jgi:dTDP-4-dehydrorhamnose reductase
MQVTIYGARGQLGRDLARRFKDVAEVSALGHRDVDITDRDAVRHSMEEPRPDLVINAAAYTDVEGAEDDRDAAFLVNETGARHVAEAAEKVDAPVVYISTDFVYCGTYADPIEPAEPLQARGVYAESKAAGESATRNANARHFVLRTAWLYGPGGNNFVEKIIAATDKVPELKIVEDEIGSPTHTFDVAEAVHAITTTEAYGTYHAVNNGSCTRFEFAKRFLEIAGIDIPVQPCKAADFPSKAPRPARAVLSPVSLETASGYTMRTWDKALMHYMERR